MNLQNRSEIATIAILLFSTWVAVCLRFWVRIGITKSLGWDDVLMLITLCLFICYCAFVLVILDRGVFDMLTISTSVTGLIPFVLLAEVFYVLTTTTLKISLGLFFLRVLTKQWQKITFYVILTVSAIYGIFYALIAIFQCGVPTMLLHNALTGHCLPTSLLLSTGYVYGSINVVADWIFVLIPISILRDSSMNRRSKISVGVIMALGALGSVASIIRLLFIEGLVFGENFFSNSVPVTFWSTIEPGVGISAASLATLRPLMRSVVHKVRGTISSRYASRNTHRKGQTGQESFGMDEFGDQTHILNSVVAGQRKASDADDAASIVSRSWSPRPKPIANTAIDKPLPIPPGQISKVMDIHITLEEW